jgi:hypothetical protein
MKKHLASLAAAKLLKKAGFNFTETSTFVFRINTREYNERPLLIDLELSAHEEKGRFIVCHLSSDHSDYKKAMGLHLTEFNF